MELGSVIFGLVALACFILPVLYYQGMKKKERNKFIQHFLQLATQQHLSISTNDSWNDRYAIGIDTQKQQLFYLKRQGDKDTTSTLDLAKVERCSLINDKRIVMESVIVDRLALAFNFRNPGQPEMILEFYLREESSPLNDEFLLAEKWKALIQSVLLPKAQLNREMGTTKLSGRAA